MAGDELFEELPIQPGPQAEQQVRGAPRLRARPARVFDQVVQQAVFGRRQVHRLTAQPGLTLLDLGVAVTQVHAAGAE